MATAGISGEMTRKQIVRLGAAISADNMAAIAEGYMNIDDVTIKNLQYENKGQAQAFNRDVIKYWTYKNPHNQVQTLAQLLYEAASDCGYVDPRKIQDILGVSRVEGEPPPKRFKGSKILELSQTRADPCNTSVTTAERDNMSEEEFEAFIQAVRPYIGKHMKITRHPWQENSEVNMDDLFTKLVLQKLHNKSYGRECVMLKCYKQLFDCSEASEVPCKKILMKGEPGTGKTTLMKKIVHDWAHAYFDAVSLVFFVPLKLVKPGEPVENVIVNKTYGLKGLKVTSGKIRSILEKFGSRCLLILDGLDEHAQGQNSDVKDIIQGEKYLHCNIIVTSRPHSTGEVEEYFDTIGRVEGFSKRNAREYAFRMLRDKDKVDQILEFNPNSTRGRDGSLFKVPILLSFMCFLCLKDKDAASCLRESEQKGFIYFRMVRCLYMAYAEKRNIKFEFSDFVKAVRSVGKLAWQTLMSGNPMFRKKELGLQVFAYGLLIGDEDAEGLSDETADILVTFAHRSIQEFFGSVWFIFRLSEGASIDSLLDDDCEEPLLDDDCEEPIFMVNPLFLDFCLWLLYYSDDTSLFSKEEKQKAQEILAIYLKGKIDKKRLDLDDQCSNFPALTDSDYRPTTIRNRLVVDFLKDALSRCSKIERLNFHASWPVDKLLSADLLRSSQIHTLCLFEDYCLDFVRSEQPERDLQIYLYKLLKPTDMLCIALKYCYHAERRPCISVDLVKNSCLELSELITNGIHQLHVDCEDGGRVSCEKDISPCPSLRQLSVHGLKSGGHVLSALRKAIRCGNLRKLNYLDFSDCSFYTKRTEGILCYLFGRQTPDLEHLGLVGLNLNKSDLQFISELKTLRYLALSVGPMLRETETVQFLFPPSPSPQSTGAWDALSELSVTKVDSEFCEEFVRAVNENKLPNLVKLDLSYHEYLYEKPDSDIEDISFLELQAEKLPRLRSLYLADLINSGQKFQDLAEKVGKWDLEILVISGSEGIGGHMSVLFHHCFPSLVYLSLSNCGLDSDDMCSLTDAREQGRLPKLKTLNVMKNRIKKVKMWEENEAWENVKIYTDYQRESDEDSYSLSSD